ncbi:17995_t:CDS:1, partial [Racocetra persica]
MSQVLTEKPQTLTQQKSIRFKKKVLKLTQEEIQLKLTRPFRSPLKKLQDQTQNIVMAKDGTTNIFEFHNAGDVKITF